MLRIGMGYDIHRLVKGRKLTLAGVTIPNPLGLWAHSDGDVLTHAICDAFLGASGLGDIGMHFPNSDPRYKNISSLKLLEIVRNKITACGFRVVNIDCALIMDKPKLSEYRKAMLNKLSKVLKIETDKINIKATTSEGVGPIGSKAIASYAVALLERKR